MNLFLCIHQNLSKQATSASYIADNKWQFNKKLETTQYAKDLRKTNTSLIPFNKHLLSIYWVPLPSSVLQIQRWTGLDLDPGPVLEATLKFLQAVKCPNISWMMYKNKRCPSKEDQMTSWVFHFKCTPFHKQRGSVWQSRLYFLQRYHQGTPPTRPESISNNRIYICQTEWAKGIWGYIYFRWLSSLEMSEFLANIQDLEVGDWSQSYSRVWLQGPLGHSTQTETIRSQPS